MRTSPSDPMIVNFSSLEILARPKQFLFEFYDRYDYPYAIQALHRMFKLVFVKPRKKKIKNIATRMFDFLQSLIELLEACWLLSQLDNRKEPANLVGEFEDEQTLLQLPVFAPDHRHYRAFQYFPRDLSFDEVLQPYLVFPKIFKLYSLADWKDKLASINRYAVGPYYNSIITDNQNVYLMPRLLGKMIAACHLIFLRESENQYPENHHTAEDLQDEPDADTENDEQ